MKRPLIDIIAGARPNFVKIAPLIRAFLKSKESISFNFRLIHTGQHYDHKMSQSFFEDLGIPAPDINLEVGSGTQATQTAGIMIAYERYLTQQPCDLCLVFGDVTSTVACAIVAKKMQIAVGHVEGGIRSGDRTMPEEINRLVTDSISDFFFVTTEIAKNHLLAEGHTEERIFFVGNLMIDSLLYQLPNVNEPPFFKTITDGRKMILLTLHRPSNVDEQDKLLAWLKVITTTLQKYQIVFPVHPRTMTNLSGHEHLYPTVYFTPALPYNSFIYLLKNAAGVITDSGGITEEASILNIPCITLRSTTERPETIELGTNILAGANPADFPKFTYHIENASSNPKPLIPLWDGKTAERIIHHLNHIIT